MVPVDFLRKLVPSFHDVDLADQTQTVRVEGTFTNQVILLTTCLHFQVYS